MLYNLFEWPTLPGARLAVIGVANTFDMPERVLPKIASRLGSARVPFQPYTKAQLVTIISQRLADADASATFEPNAIDFASRKVGCGNMGALNLGLCAMMSAEHVVHLKHALCRHSDDDQLPACCRFPTPCCRKLVCTQQTQLLVPVHVGSHRDPTHPVAQ